MTAIQLIQITPEELKSDLVHEIRKELEILKKEYRPKEPTVYLTRIELAKLLKIDISTVHNWTKKGKLKSYGIGNRVYYKRNEIEAALIELK